MLLPNLWLLPSPGGGGGGGEGGHKETRQGRKPRQAAGTLGQAQTANTGNHSPPPPTPPTQSSGRRECQKPGAPAGARARGSPGQGRNKQPSCPLSAPDPTSGRGEEARLAGVVLPL